MHEDTIEYLDKSLEINPKHEGALYYKAKALFETERYDEALTFIDKVLETDPDNQQAAEHKKIILNEKGRLSLELEKPEEALVWFDKALEIDPNYELAIKNKELAKKDKEFLKNDEVLTPETEEIDYDSIRPFFLLAISGGVYYMFYFVRKRRQKYIRKTRQIINEPSFSVLKIRWGGLNITYLVIFDKERILFIRPDKISTDRLDWSLDEILDMDKQNFGIPFDEVAKIELKHSTYGVNGIRAGKMIISYKNHQDSFDILPTEAFDH